MKSVSPLDLDKRGKSVSENSAYEKIKNKTLIKKHCILLSVMKQHLEPPIPSAGLRLTNQLKRLGGA